ncbi:NADH:flavin oxidoreductase/NADH oxidase family protein [Alphaproteobacteria bacterium KMM 3653]|uniref:NADH:flavin oxidoreductase/NADH oxidase family protein n=1 Tax=Harenicola maris TaxID=2841044 RepID=A0AAP2CNH4_9RHOB|nr:NADH:flavin oxidoreductase/NADH oxidase family protein [Harenicola maris]
MAAGVFEGLRLPCGLVLKNRIAKSAMSDSLGDGRGAPTAEQGRLYARWAEGGLGLAVIGEVQVSPHYAEKPGNLVLNAGADLAAFRALARQGGGNGAQIWPQLGHAGALAYGPISAPVGPSALDLPGLRCGEMGAAEIAALPAEFAASAARSQEAGFGGVQIHAAHGFLLSQFLSPLFNKRVDGYGGPIENRMRLLLEVIEAVRGAVGPAFAIGVKLNSSDQLEGGLAEAEALQVIAALDRSSVDLIDISGGTYFPGAKAASDSGGRGPYFMGFARQARRRTSKPLMLTGGFKTRAQAEEALASGVVDVVGMARALVLAPDLPEQWRAGRMPAPEFPRFAETPEGGVTAWYTMRMSDLAEERAPEGARDIGDAMRDYAARDAARAEIWRRHFL